MGNLELWLWLRIFAFGSLFFAAGLLFGFFVGRACGRDEQREARRPSR